MGYFLFGYFIWINSLAWYLMYTDKRKAMKNAWRVPESHLLVFTLVGGFIGIYLGMKYNRHKTKHWQFHVAVIFSAFLWLLAIPAFYLYLQV